MFKNGERERECVCVFILVERELREIIIKKSEENNY